MKSELNLEQHSERWFLTADYLIRENKTAGARLSFGTPILNFLLKKVVEYWACIKVIFLTCFPFFFLYFKPHVWKVVALSALCWDGYHVDSISSISEILFFLGFLSSTGREAIFGAKGRVATAKLAGRLVKNGRRFFKLFYIIYDVFVL